MQQAIFLAGTLIVTLGAIWEHRRWSRVLVVLGVLLILLAVAPSFGLMMFT